MIRQLGFWGILGVGLLVSASPASSLSAAASLEFAGNRAEHMQLASFFGRPYPYGYTGWGPCIRYIEVETPQGPRLRRVRSCGPVLRSAG
jgi:hypothetical protein